MTNLPSTWPPSLARWPSGPSASAKDRATGIVNRPSSAICAAVPRRVPRPPLRADPDEPADHPRRQRDPEEVARARGRKMVDVRKVYYAGKV